MAREKPRSRAKGIGKAILLLIVLTALIVGGIFAYQYSKQYIPKSEANQTVNIGNQTIVNQNTTIVEKSNPWYAMTVIAVAVVAAVTLIFIAYFASKYLSKVRPTHNKSKEKCILSAKTHLQINTEPIFSYPFYGGDEEKFPAWAFVFKDYLGLYKSCRVKAGSLEVYNEEEGISPQEIKEQLRMMRFAKVGGGVPDTPTKTEKEPGWADLFQDQSAKATFSTDFGGQPQ